MTLSKDFLINFVYYLISIHKANQFYILMKFKKRWVGHLGILIWVTEQISKLHCRSWLPVGLRFVEIIDMSP